MAFVAGIHLGHAWAHTHTRAHARVQSITPPRVTSHLAIIAEIRQGTRGAKGRVKKKAPMKGEKRSDPNRFTPGQQHTRHPRKTHRTSA